MHLASGACILPRLLQWSGNGIISQMLYWNTKEFDVRCSNETWVDSAMKENRNATSLSLYV